MKLKDFESLAVVTEDLRLFDKRDAAGQPVRVRVVWDEKAGKAYQVDTAHLEFREAKSALGPYGSWKKLAG